MHKFMQLFVILAVSTALLACKARNPETTSVKSQGLTEAGEKHFNLTGKLADSCMPGLEDVQTLTGQNGENVVVLRDSNDKRYYFASSLGHYQLLQDMLQTASNKDAAICIRLSGETRQFAGGDQLYHQINAMNLGDAQKLTKEVADKLANSKEQDGGQFNLTSPPTDQPVENYEYEVRSVDVTTDGLVFVSIRNKNLSQYFFASFDTDLDQRRSALSNHIAAMYSDESYSVATVPQLGGRVLFAPIELLERLQLKRYELKIPELPQATIQAHYTRTFERRACYDMIYRNDAVERLMRSKAYIEPERIRELIEATRESCKTRFPEQMREAIEKSGLQDEIRERRSRTNNRR